MQQQEKIQVLFVCLGNICRSTMAEAVMRHLVKEAELGGYIRVDSAGTAAYHVGEPPHEGTRRKLKAEGIACDGIEGRQITRQDLQVFDYIIGMDTDNIRGILELAKGPEKDKVHLLSNYARGGGWVSVPDPWYTGDFEQTYQLVLQGCQGLLQEIREQNGI